MGAWCFSQISITMKIFFLFAGLLTSVSAFSQFEKKDVIKETVIGKAKTTGVKFSELSYFVGEGNDTTFHFYYKDKTYTKLNVWESVFFKGGNKTLDDLYTALKGYLEADKNTENYFKLGESDILAKSSRMMGTKYISLAIKNKAGTISITDLTGKQIDDLFDREH